MAYQKYTGLTNAVGILEKVSEFAAAQGWTVIENNVDDLSIDGSGMVDGVKLSLSSPDGIVFANFRSANGKKIFDTQKNDTNAYGIGLICSTAHTNKPASGKWFDQPNAPLHFGTQQVIGVGVPVNPAGNYTLYVNSILDPAPMLLISIETGGVFQHLVAGYLEKVGDWDGGIVFSGSRNSVNMFSASNTFDSTTIEAESVALFSMTTNANTFLQADIDAAPLRLPAVLWASAGPQDSSNISYAYTGKQLALPLKSSEVIGASWNAFIPDYTKLQSLSPTDTGRNVNTLNNITLNMNLTAYVLRDPDGLRNFSPVGYIPGMYFISMRNVAPGQTYEIKYPQSGALHQVFPNTRRRGKFGMDGFSIKQ
jgi:hypothetical protein